VTAQAKPIGPGHPAEKETKPGAGYTEKPRNKSSILAVVADGFDRAAFEGFHALLDPFFGSRLFVDEGITAVLIAGKVVGRGFAAQITINALLVHVKLTRNVLGPFVCDVCHDPITESAVGLKSSGPYPEVLFYGKPARSRGNGRWTVAGRESVIHPCPLVEILQIEQSLEQSSLTP